MADLITQVPIPNAPMVMQKTGVPVKAWFDFFTTLWLRTGGSTPDASIALDTLGSTRGGMLARFATSWLEFEATVANTVPVMNPGGATDVQLFTISQLLDLIGSVRGDILFRGAAGWQVLAPVAAKFLRSNGAADPSWEDTPGAGAWVDYVPTLTPTAGAITTLGALSGRYVQFGKIVFVSINVAITTNGTGATSLNVGLPVASAGVVCLSGRENLATGKMVYATAAAASATAIVQYYDNSYPGANNTQFIFGGSYEVP